jgi:hypothetical protein
MCIGRRVGSIGQVKKVIENQLPISEWVVSIDFSAAN